MANNFKYGFTLTSISLLVAGAILALSWQAFFNQVNDIAYDFALRVAGPLTPSSDVQIVSIDEESLDRVGAWPWSRTEVARLITRIDEAHPRAMAIDLLWDDPGEPQNDQDLRHAIEAAENIVLAARVDDSTGQLRWRFPLEMFRADTVHLGHVHADPDLDGVIRRVSKFKQAEGEIVSALSVELLRLAGELPDGFEQGIGGSVRIVPESLIIRFAGDRGTFSQVPAWEVLANRIPPSAFTDRIVLVGVTAEGVGDDWMTPFSASGRRMSGIEIHANALDSILAGRTVRVVPDWIIWLGLALLIGGLYGLDRRFEGKRFYFMALGAIPLLVGVSLVLLGELNLWLPFPPFLAAVGLVVPALEVEKLVRVNRNLDRKISTLSAWAAEGEASTDQASVLQAGSIEEVTDPGIRRQWRQALDSYEAGRVGRRTRRERLLGARRHPAHWKLDAVDFFNEQLYRFVSFNQAVLAGIEDVIVVSDPAGRVVYQNPAAGRVRGYRSEDPPPGWQYLSSLLDGRNLLDDFAAVLVSNEPRNFQDVAGADGLRFYSVTLRAIANIGVIAILHDVTAQHALNQAKNEMVSLVSHELRTPLTSIRGYGDMLLKYGLVEGKGSGFLESILSETDRLNELIQSFLDIAHIESGRRRLDISDVDPARIVEDLTQSHAHLAEQKEIRLVMGDTKAGLTVRGDRLLLYQALANLITNAIKYSPRGALVRIRAAENSDGGVCFRVEDEGYGIPPEHAGRVFEKFYRRPNPETREESGFGLGLAFVREVAELHGGDVSLESTPGEGSVFSLRIPL